MRDRRRRAVRPRARPDRVAVVASRYHETIVRRLVEGAVGTLRAAGLRPDRIEVHRVPGAYETPMAADRLAATRRYDAIVAVGVVLRGETVHFEHVVGEAARGLSEVARARGLPVTFGVVAAETPAQARSRAGGRVGNRGAEAARAALEMIDLYRRIERGAGRAA